MIDAGHLLTDLQRLLKTVESDLRRRCADNPEVDARVRAEYNKAKSASRTSQAYEVWRDEFITQVAVAWILACVFVRFIEDNRMLDEPAAARAWLAGPSERLRLARDHHTLYFRDHPTESDREYLEHVFRAAANPTGKRPIPVVQALFDEEHNPLWRLGVSGDGATALLNFWQQVEPETGELRHDFTDPEWNTRFLGDLYQDLSEAARKKYALLQTPEFVEEFILDRTLGPAIDEFGYQAVRVIDPTCGSGHFLLGAFGRLFDLYVRNEPGVNAPELARRALSQVYGVDLNPFAVAIARFRLLVASMKTSGVERLQDAPGFEFNLAVGDSLLHGPARGDGGDQMNMMWSPLAHVYEAEDKEQLNRILMPGRYHAVIGNPPYIAVKDAALNKAYRERFGACSGKYSLTVPFMERFFDLAVRVKNVDGAGHVGMITSNSFMKREFGKKLIEQYIPRWDLTHVIDTAGAYIPGHGTPTVILLGRNRKPVAETIRTVMGIKGEPSDPSDPAKGQVWTSITAHVDVPGSQNEFISVTDAAREKFHRHPWSIGGGGAAELKVLLDEISAMLLKDVVSAVGITAVTGEDDLYIIPDEATVKRMRVEDARPLVSGDKIRDWLISRQELAIWLYGDNFDLKPISAFPNTTKILWPCKSVISKRKRFGVPMLERGLTWYEWQELYPDKFRTALSIVFAAVATHNHFVLDRGGNIFKQSALIIKMPADTVDEEHYALLGLLNSSTACFWMKQVFYPKGTTTGDISTEKGKPEANRYDFAATGMLSFPLPKAPEESKSVTQIARMIDSIAHDLMKIEPEHLIKQWIGDSQRTPLQSLFEEGRRVHQSLKRRMVVLQEELDWEVYKYYGIAEEGADAAILSDEDRGVAPEDRPCFWSTDESPSTLAAELRLTYQRRRKLLSSVPNLSLLETAICKRLWLGQQGVFGHATSSYEDRAKDALKGFMLDKLEEPRYWSVEELTTTARLADRVRSDRGFMRAAEMYRGHSNFDVANLVAELVKSEAVPFLPALRYKPSGLRNRQVWEQVWEMQRREDAIDARTKLPDGDPQRLTESEANRLKAQQVGDIPVPPKYKSTDFLEQTFWRLRGKLDVPKERFVSYPKCERDADPTLPITWAGWDYLQQARSLAAYYEQMKNEGWGPTRLVPLLAGIVELLPWLEQWHNEVDPTYGTRMGDFFRGFVEEEARAYGLTLNKIRDWSPSA